MDNKNNIDRTEKYQEQIKGLFKELATQELYDKWTDTFEIDITNEKQVTVIYHGSEDVKEFKKECKETLVNCIYSAMGEVKKIKITQKSVFDALSPKTKKNIKAAKFFVVGMAFVCIATIVIVVLCNYITNRSFRETFYNTSSIKVDSNLRIIQLSDLHRSSYGKNNKRLLERVKALEPDIILCTGDIIDSRKFDVDYAVNLAKELSKIAPSYYIYGNHETESIYDFPLNEQALDEKFGFENNNRDETAILKLEDSFEKKLEAAGIKVLKNEKDTIKVKTMTIDVYGVLNSNPSAFWSYTEKSFAEYINETPDNFKITAIHEPYIFEEFNPEYWGDIMFCGHTHGGVVRVPMLGPLFTKDNGLFPEKSGHFIYGRYDVAGSPLIVSGGLENSNLLRINNEPELVIVDVNKF